MKTLSRSLFSAVLFSAFLATLEAQTMMISLVDGRDNFLRVDPRHPISLGVLRDHRRMCGR